MNTHVHVNHCLAKRHHISRGHHSSTKDISKAHDFLAFSRIHCMSIYESGFEGLLHKDYIMLLLLGPKDASTVILVPIKNVTPDEGWEHH
ncbi:unnamed protein product [Lactuca saligna]|uniref:Uncharacterized protein n=1 Tax=Lactuca saligna TaxID=75948 RepID=A0AA35ZD61_LACSI|nr:unnamed protein product [Lactuca saligna]